MYNILLTDDEQIVIDSLTFIIDKNFHDQVTFFQAQSGSDAINIIQSTKIDIVFMDINMPGLNGLQAISQIKQLNSNIVVIILSAFDKFTYAQEAMNLGAYKYLTKPFNKNTITQTVKDAITIIDTKRNQLNSDIHLKEKLNFVSSMVESDFIYSTIFSSKETINIDAYLSYFHISKQNWVFCCIEIPMNTSSNQNQTYLKIRDILSSSNECIIGSLMINRIVVLISLENVFIDKTDKASLAEYFLHIHSKLSLQISTNLKIGVSTLQLSMDNMIAAYNEAFSALNQIISPSGILLYETQECSKSLQDLSTTLKNASLTILSRIKAGDISGVFSEIQAFFIHIDDSSKEKLELIKNDFFELLINVKNLILTIDNTYKNTEENLFLSLSTCTTKDEIKNFVLSRLTEYTTTISELKNKQGNPIIEKVYLYITEHLNETITLEKASDYAKINPFYLSKLFKEKTGENFIDYVTHIKLSKSKEMLRNNQYSIKEVSHNVGYSDQNYFSKIFKRKFGLTPTEYKNSLQGRNQ